MAGHKAVIADLHCYDSTYASTHYYVKFFYAHSKSIQSI